MIREYREYSCPEPRFGIVDSWPHFNPKVGSHATMEMFSADQIELAKESLDEIVISRHKAGPYSYLWEAK